MIHEAAVFQLADEAAQQAFGLIGPQDMDSELPPLFDMPGADQAVPLRQVLVHDLPRGGPGRRRRSVARALPGADRATLVTRRTTRA